MKVTKKVSRYPNIIHGINNNPHLNRQEDLMSTDYHPISITPTQMEPRLKSCNARNCSRSSAWTPPKSTAGLETVAETPPQ